MFKAARDIMKIIWNGIKDIRSNIDEYCGHDALKTYFNLKRSIKAQERPQEELEKGLWGCTWQIQCVERKILFLSLSFLVLCFFGMQHLIRGGDGTRTVIFLAALLLLYWSGLCLLFKRRYKLTAKRQLLEQKLADSIKPTKAATE